jgi:hypothetical protein
MNKKVIRATITLVGDTFDETGSNVLIYEGLRTSVVMRFGGGAIMPSAEITAYGLSLSAMHKLMRIRWQDLNSMLNRIRIEAGEQGQPLTHVFEGNITFAYIDTSNAPEIALRISSMAGILEAYRPASQLAFPGETPVVRAIADICERMGYIFENNGVPESLTMQNVTMGDTDMNKIRKLCRDYQIDLYVEHGLIAIAPQGAPRALRIPVLTPKTGLLGYPVPTIQGVDVRCLWDPMVRFGGIIRIADSLMETTNGDWRAFGVTTTLESELPGGAWFMDIQATFRGANDAAISRA